MTTHVGGEGAEREREKAGTREKDREAGLPSAYDL
jgi:hypothetical protein